MNFISAYRKIGWNVTLTYMLTAWMSLCLNAIIPLSIGGIPWSASTGESSKGKLLHMLGIEFKTMEGFMLFFALMILLKTALVISERWLQQRIRFKALAIAQYSWLEQFNPSPEHHTEDVSKKAKSFRNYIVKVVYRMPPDILYFALLIVALALISGLFAWITIVLFAVALLSTSVISKLITHDDFTKTSARAFRQWLKIAGSLRLTHQLSLARTAINQATQDDERHELKRTRTKAILQGWLTMLFFGNMMLIIGLALRTPNTYNTADVLSFILLLLYMQSTYKRMGRNLSAAQHLRHDLQALAQPIVESTHGNIQTFASSIVSLPQKLNVFQHPKGQSTLTLSERLAVQTHAANHGIQLCWVQKPSGHLDVPAWKWLCGAGEYAETEACVTVLQHFLETDLPETRAWLNKDAKAALEKADIRTSMAWACAQAVCSKSQIIVLEWSSHERMESPIPALIEKLQTAPALHDFKIVIYEYSN